MTLPPIARRELLMLSKRRWTWHQRWILGAVLLFSSGGLSLLLGNFGFGGGRSTLQALAFFICLFCLIAGVHATSDSISSERRQGTLPLLFLTWLRPSEIIFGKLIATAVATFYGVLVAAPIVALAVLGGGILPMDLLQLFCATLNTLFLAAALGLLCSCLARERKTAVGLGTWSILLLYFTPTMATAVVAFPEWAWLAQVSRFFNVGQTFVLGRPFGFSHSPWIPMFTLHLIAWAALWVAIGILPRRFQDKPAGDKTSLGWRDRLKQLSYGSFEVRARRRSRLLERNPFLWLSARGRFRAISPILVILFIGTVSAFVLAEVWSTAVIFVTGILMSLALKLHLCLVAPQKMTAEVENGTLELLLATPLTTREMIRGQLLALWGQFGIPLIIVTLICVAGVVSLIGSNHQLPDSVVIAAQGLCIFIVIDFFVIALLGLYVPLVAKRPDKSSSGILWRALLLPGLAMFALGVFTMGDIFQVGFAMYIFISAIVAFIWCHLVLSTLGDRLQRKVANQHGANEPPSLLHPPDSRYAYVALQDESHRRS